MTKTNVSANAIHLGDKWAHGHPVLDGKTVTGVIYEFGQIEVRLNEGEHTLTFLPGDMVAVDRTSAKPEPTKTRTQQHREEEQAWRNLIDVLDKRAWADMDQSMRDLVMDLFDERGVDFEEFAKPRGIPVDGGDVEEAPVTEKKSFWERLRG